METPPPFLAEGFTPLDPVTLETIAGLARERRSGGRPVPPCPHCGELHVHRWGRARGRQRFRCTGCRRTFSDFTGLPIARTWYPERWPRFCQELLKGTSVRATARRLNIAPGTAFRWRHRVLQAALEVGGERLSGTVGMVRSRIPHSAKGPTGPVGRPARKRSVYYWEWIEGSDRPYHRVYIAADAWSRCVVEAGMPDEGEDLVAPLERLLRTATRGKLHLQVNRTDLGAWRGRATRSDWALEAVPHGPSSLGAIRGRIASRRMLDMAWAKPGNGDAMGLAFPVGRRVDESPLAYAGRLREALCVWIGRFYGVSSRWLSSYFHLFRWVVWGHRPLGAGRRDPPEGERAGLKIAWDLVWNGALLKEGPVARNRRRWIG